MSDPHRAPFCGDGLRPGPSLFTASPLSCLDSCLNCGSVARYFSLSRFQGPFDTWRNSSSSSSLGEQQTGRRPRQHDTRRILPQRPPEGRELQNRRYSRTTGWATQKRHENLQTDREEKEELRKVAGINIDIRKNMISVTHQQPADPKTRV